MSLSKKFVSVTSNVILTCLFSWSITGLAPSAYLYLIVGFIKSTMLFLNAVYFGFSALSPTSVSTQFGFPTEISVILFPFPEVSLIVLSAIEIFTAPSYVPKFPNVNVYPVSAPSNSAVFVIFVNVLVIVVIGLLGFYYCLHILIYYQPLMYLLSNIYHVQVS